MSRVPPHDRDAEESVLGAMLLTRPVRDEMFNTLAPADFFFPIHGGLFQVMYDLDQEGRVADRLVLRDRMTLAGYDIAEQDILRLQGAAPIGGYASAHASIVLRLAIARRTLLVLDDAAKAAWAGNTEAAGAALERAHEVLSAPFDDVADPVDALDLATEDHNLDWVVRGLLARHEIVLIVAEPGSGKTTLLNQFAACCAAGLHPWTRIEIPKRRVLVFDFQDSRGSRGRSVQHMLHLAGGRIERGWLGYELRTQGIDLTTRADQRWFEGKVAKYQPDIVIAGPLYNMVAGGPQRSKQSEETAQLAASFLAEMTVRRNCSMLVEAHAPHGEELRVRGSKLWEDWAGWGFGLKASYQAGARQYDVVRFRGDRETGRQWPEQYVQGHPGHWPWEVPVDKLPPDPTGGTEPLVFTEDVAVEPDDDETPF